MSQTPVSSRNVGACTCAHVHALLPPDGHYQICVSAGSPICPHAFEFHYYLTAANKQFMPLNWGNTLYPDTRLSNHHDVLSLPSSSYGKENTWRSSTDNRPIIFCMLSKAALELEKFSQASLADQILGIE